MSTIASLAAELKAWFASLETLTCLPFVRRAYQDIRRARKWSFLFQNGVVFAPDQIIGGSVTVTQFSTSVVFDATSAALVNAVATTSAPALPLIFRQFRVVGGPIYNISSWTFNSPSAGLGTMVLARPYTEQSGSGLSYMVYQPYLPAPSVDFDLWKNITDAMQGYRFRRRNLYRTQPEVDRADPWRQNFDWPIWAATHDYVTLTGDTQARPRFEFWPQPIVQRGYVVEYFVKGDNVSDTDLFPAPITDQCVMARARHYGYQYLATQENITADRLRAILSQQKVCEAEYADLLNRCKLEDNCIFESAVEDAEDDLALSGPLDADYLLGHDVVLIR